MTIYFDSTISLLLCFAVPSLLSVIVTAFSPFDVVWSPVSWRDVAFAMLPPTLVSFAAFVRELGPVASERSRPRFSSAVSFELGGKGGFIAAVRRLPQLDLQLATLLYSNGCYTVICELG
ncbi:hypothetical protein T08_9228 [Trichinella sp. T8]|nr:hypothetical protein T08_9228 [Trichinella sp. T8]